LSSPLACLSFCFWLQLYAYVIYEYTKYLRDVVKGDNEKSKRRVRSIKMDQMFWGRELNVERCAFRPPSVKLQAAVQFWKTGRDRIKVRRVFIMFSNRPHPPSPRLLVSAN
jgi:hypothetical protein